MTTPRPEEPAPVVDAAVTTSATHPNSQAKEMSTGAAVPVQPSVTVAPADQVLTLVSSSVVNQRAFANTCGIPLGAHMDLQPSSDLGLPRITGRGPLRCNGCSGFMNVYCKTNLLKWVWKCNMCGTVNISKEQLGRSADVLSYPELCAEAVEYVEPLNPGSLSPPLPPPDQPAPRPHLVFAVDTTMCPSDLQAAKEAILAAATGPHLPPTTRVSLISFDGCVAVHNLGTLRCSHVLPATSGAVAAAAAAAGPDGSLPAALDQQSVIQQLLARHSAGNGGGGVDGGSEPVAEALVAEVGSCASQLPRVLASLRTVQADVAVRARARSLCPAVEASLRLIAAAASPDPTRHHNLYGSRVVVLAGGPATRGPGAVPLELLDQAVSEKGRTPENRAVAAALDVGAALGAMAAKIGVAVDVFTSTSTGINARMLTAICHGSGGELMPSLAAPVHLHHLNSILTHHQHQHQHDHQQQQQQQQEGVQSPSSAAAASSSNGGAAAAAGPASDASKSGPSSDGRGGGVGGFLGPVLARQLVVALGRRFGLEGRLDCYCSEGLRLVQWMGPLDTIKFDQRAEEANAAAAAPGATPPAAAPTAAPTPSPASFSSSSGPWRLSSAACGVVSLEAGRCASLRLEVTRDLMDVPSLVLQVVLHFADPSSRLRVVRVVTRKLAVVDNRAEFLRTVNPTAAAAMLGKRAVLDAKKAGAFRDARRAEEARYAVAAQLGLIAARCGKEVQTSRGLLGFGGRKLRQWPPELMPLAYALYHFHRGPILGPPTPAPPGTHPASASPPSHHAALWDCDCRLAGLNALLWAAWQDAYRAMTPKLYAVLPPGQPPAPWPALAALPCVSLAAVMARTVPLLLDAGTAVLVSPTEEPGHGHHDQHGEQPHATANTTTSTTASEGAIAPTLLAAALAAAGCPPPVFTTGAGGGAMVVTEGAPPLRRRVPVPSVALAPGAQAGEGLLAARLIPCHHDAYEEQALQHPQLQQLGPAVAAQLSKQLREGEAAAAKALAAAAAAGLPPVQARQAAGVSAAAAASFVQWCRGVGVQPFPLAP